MKNIILTCSLATLTYTAPAQIKLAPMVGTHFTQAVLYANAKRYGTLNRSKGLNMHVGTVADVRLSDRFSLQPALLFQNNGFERPALPSGQKADKQIPLYTAECHLAVAYKAPLRNKSKLFIGLDEFAAKNLKPYTIRYGTSAATTYITTTLKRPYLGVIVYAGYELKNGIFARVSYQRVLSNIYAVYSNFVSPSIGVVYYNYGITAGYFIQRHPKKPNTANTPESQ